MALLVCVVVIVIVIVIAVRTASLLGVFVALVAFALAGCGSPSASFRPYSAVDRDNDGITPDAVEVLEGDVHYLDDVTTKIVGTVVVQGGGEDARERKAACIAARNGGTHIIQRSQWTAVTGARTAIFAAGNSAFARTHLDTENGTAYLVLRVNRREWGKLPEPLRPAGVETFKQPIWNGDPKLWECH